MCNFNSKLKGFPFVKDEMDMLLNHASIDETRPLLNGFYYDKNNFLVSTDGGSLYLTNSCNMIENLNKNLKGKIISVNKQLEAIDSLKDLRNYQNIIEGTFPSYKQVVPRDQVDIGKYKKTIELEVPLWIKKCSQRRGAMRIGLNLKTGVLSFEDTDKSEDASRLNLKYLKTYAGKTINIWTKDKSSAFLISENGIEEPLKAIKKDTPSKDDIWLGVIMPLRY